MVAFKEPLSNEEERYWLSKLKDGDPMAKDVLVEHNLRLVAHIMKKYMGCDKDVEDMLSIGTIGLIKAVNTFKESKGSKLIWTYWYR